MAPHEGVMNVWLAPASDPTAARQMTHSTDRPIPTYLPADLAKRLPLFMKFPARLIAEARRMDKHAMIGGIAAENAASIALHVRFGFVETARMPQVGFKFGRWLDLVFVQRILDGT